MKLFGLFVSCSLIMVSACSFVNRVPTPTALSRADDSELYKDPYPSLTQVPQSAPQGYTPNRGQITNTLAADQANAVRAAQQPLSPRPTAPSPYSSPTASAAPYSNQPTALASRPSANSLLDERRSQVGAYGPPTAGGTQGYAPPTTSGPTPSAIPSAPSTDIPARPNVAPIQPIQPIQGGQTSPVQQPQPTTAAVARPVQPITPPNFEEPKGKKVAVVYFGHASSKISDNDIHVLLNVAAYHKKQGGQLSLVGHASSTANATDQRAALESNHKMSIKRVEAVGSMLLRMGVPKDKIDADARASFQAGTSDREARRVDIYHSK